MGRSKDLSDFQKGQIVMARRLGQSISQTADLVGCSRFAVVSTYQKWCKEGKPVNRRQGVGRPRLIDEQEERRLAFLVQSDGKATVAQIAETLNADHEKKVSEHTVHRSLLRMGLGRRRSARGPTVIPVHRRKRLQWAGERQKWTSPAQGNAETLPDSPRADLGSATKPTDSSCAQELGQAGM